MPRLTQKLWAFAALSALSLTAQAHTPYLFPNVFHASNRKPVISVDVSLTDNFFIPDVAYGDHPFSVITPNGSVVSIPKRDVYQLPLRTVVEHKLVIAEGADPAGTYRVVAGPRVSAPIRSWEINGEVRRVRDPNEQMPDGAELKSHSQSVSTMEAYVTVGAARVAAGESPRPEPDTQALKATGKGLEIVPVNHPNQLRTGDSFEFRVQFNGQPLPDHKVDVVYSNMDFSGKTTRASLNTDHQGTVSYAVGHAGVYMAMVRYSEDAPLSATKPNQSYSHALTFKVAAAQEDNALAGR